VDDATARTLNRINAAFYRERAGEFSATREGPWPGWLQLRDVLEAEGLLAPGPAAARDGPLRVLDVACGNARFGRFLADGRPDRTLHYTGVDASPELLALARARGGLGDHPQLRVVDLVEDDLDAALRTHRSGLAKGGSDAALRTHRFDLGACFGLLHHLPGRARRKALLATLLSRLRPDGLLVVTCWRLALFERFQGRAVPWEEWNAAAAPDLRVDPAQLEPGDRLLPFGNTLEGEKIAGQPRYVHFAHEDETAELLAELPCERVAEFVADGRDHNLNRYFALRPKGLG